MTVADLIAKLQTLPKAMKIAHEYDGMWTDRVQLCTVPALRRVDDNKLTDTPHWKPTTTCVVVMVLPRKGETSYYHVERTGMRTVRTT